MTPRGDFRKGLVHVYEPKVPRLTAFEHVPHSSAENSQNIVIFIGGLFDGLRTVEYPSSISDALPDGWSLAQVHLSSSYTGWGYSSLAKDAEELAKCVEYFRSIKSGKIILLGHSTGCQDVMRYLTGAGREHRPAIDGAIIQAPLSDRESIDTEIDSATSAKITERAKAMVEEGKKDDIVPMGEIASLWSNPVTAYRWLSLASPDHDGDDDYFSTDLTDDQLKKTFGQLPSHTPLCIIFSGSDEYVSKAFSPVAQLARWTEIIQAGSGVLDEESSGVVEGASHNLLGNEEIVVERLVKRVTAFLRSLE